MFDRKDHKHVLGTPQEQVEQDEQQGDAETGEQTGEQTLPHVHRGVEQVGYRPPRR